MKRLLLLLLAFAITACTNDPEPSPKDLTLLVTQADSLTTSTFPFVYQLTAQSDGKPIADAEVSVQENSGPKESLGKTAADGTVAFTETSVTGVVGEWTRYTFTASKSGHETSTVTRFLKYELGLVINVSDTSVGNPGEEIGVSVVVTAGAQATSDVTLHVLDHKTGFTTPVPTTNGAGIYYYQVPFSDPSVLRFTATAVKAGYAPASREFFIRPDIPARKLTGFAMTSLSSSSIGLMWDALSGFSGEYKIDVFDGASFVKSWTGTTTTATIDGLNPNIEYTFKSTVDGSEEVYGKWATAKRLPFEIDGTQTVRIWETGAQSASKGSALIISGSGLRVTTTKNTADHPLIDLVLAYNADPAVPVSFVAPGVSGSDIPLGKQTVIGETFHVTGGLDKDFYTGPIEGLFTGNYNAVDIALDNPSSAPLVIPVRLTDEQGQTHYGRIEVIKQPSGRLLGEDGLSYFVDVRVSYQTMQNTAYAGQPRPKRNDAVRRSAPTRRK